MKIFTWRQRLTVLLVNMIGIAIFGGAGFLLDETTGSRPLFTFVGVFVSFPFTQFALAKTLKKQYKHTHGQH